MKLSRLENAPASAVWKARAVHAFTALGAIAGLFALFAIARAAWFEAFMWMGAALLIDGMDGTLARRCDVRRHTPNFDGALLDNVVDYLNYVAVPAFFLYEAGIVPGLWGAASSAAVMLASAYQFCQRDSKTPDRFFKGFPCYWNIVAFYLFFLGLPAWGNVAVVLTLAAAVFAPVKFLYPSRTPQWRRVTLPLTILWAGLLAVLLAQYPAPDMRWLRLSLGYVVYYAAASIFMTLRGRNVGQASGVRLH